MKKILQQPNGARFYKCDLHIHTPQDKRFKVPKDIDFNTDRGKKAFAHLFVTSAIDKGIEIIAITEHNSVEWVDLIREAAENTNLHVFPGFEINTKSGAGGIHLLCIFNPTTSSSTLDDIITQLGLPRNDRFHGDGSCKLCNKSIAETIEFINDQGGLTIAAHVLSEHGILKSESMKGEVRVKAWNNPTLSAAELPNPRFTLEKKANFIGRVLRNEAELYKRERSIAPVYSSDARSLSEIGSQYTLVKLSSITIGGLQQAFLDWESRVRHFSEVSDRNFTRIVAAEWEGGFLDKFAIHFNDNLNCLIGGKGTGKSAIIESLRYGFGLNPKGDEVKKQHEELMENAIRPGSTIRILVENHIPKPTKYVIERAYCEEPRIYRWNETTCNFDVEIPNVSPTNLFPDIEFYGQKEILELSRNPSIQINLLTRFADNQKLKETSDKIEKISLWLRVNHGKIVESQEAIKTSEILEDKKEFYVEKLRLYKESGLLQKFEEKRKYVEEENIIENVDAMLAKLYSKIDSVQETIVMSDFSFIKDTEIKELPHKESLAKLRDQLYTDFSDLIKYSEDMTKTLNKAISRVQTFKDYWKNDNDKQQKRYQKKLREIQQESFNPEDVVN